MERIQHIVDTPLGWMVISGSVDHISEAKWVAEEEITVAMGTGKAEWTEDAQRQVMAYFNNEKRQFNLPLKPKGTTFQEMIWQKLLEIPFGSTTTYSALASPDQARAVGAAVGANPILLLIPCHRVIGSDGSLTGYAGGKERKEELLQLEGANQPQQLSLF